MAVKEFAAYGIGIELFGAGAPSLLSATNSSKGRYEAGSGDERLHGVDLEQRGIMIPMFDIRGGSGEQHAWGPCGRQRFDATVPGLVCGWRRVGEILAATEKLGQRVVFGPGPRGPFVKTLEQIGAVITGQHRRAKRHGIRNAGPGGFGHLQQLERVGPGQLLLVAYSAGNGTIQRAARNPSSPDG